MHSERIVLTNYIYYIYILYLEVNIDLPTTDLLKHILLIAEVYTPYSKQGLQLALSDQSVLSVLCWLLIKQLLDSVCLRRVCSLLFGGTLWQGCIYNICIYTFFLYYKYNIYISLFYNIIM